MWECEYGGRRAVVRLSGGVIEVYVRSPFREERVQEVELGSIEDVKYSEGALTIRYDGKELALEQAPRELVSSIVRPLRDKVAGEIERDAEQLLGVVLEASEKLSLLTDVAASLHDRSDYEAAIKAAEELSRTHDVSNLLSALRAYEAETALEEVKKLAAAITANARERVTCARIDCRSLVERALGLVLWREAAILLAAVGGDYSDALANYRDALVGLFGAGALVGVELKPARERRPVDSELLKKWVSEIKAEALKDLDRKFPLP